MLGQMSFPGFEGVSPDATRPVPGWKWRGPRKRFKLFFALFPEPEIAEAISSLGSRLDRQYGIGGQPLRPERLHITLHVLGEYDERPETDVDSARRAGDAVVARAFDVVFDHALTFRGPEAYVLRVGEGAKDIVAFWQCLGIAIADVRPYKKPSFTPHMTLSYKGRTMTEHAVAPIRWAVKEFVLINSHVGDTYHEVMGRWPLRA